MFPSIQYLSWKWYEWKNCHKYIDARISRAQNNSNLDIYRFEWSFYCYTFYLLLVLSMKLLIHTKSWRLVYVLCCNLTWKRGCYTSYIISATQFWMLFTILFEICSHFSARYSAELFWFENDGRFQIIWQKKFWIMWQK